ncbi:MAG: WYL domain-containing protein [Bacillota bacterium]|nr:WYL domain-containing protein [Bacillota bacterium]
MLTDRANAICLLEILREYSDAEHILPMRDVLSKMNTIYYLKLDRRTVYSAVALLIDLGYDVSVYEENGIGYYLRSRQLEEPEILLLTDAVYSFPFIPAKQSEQLIAKLQKQLSTYQRRQYRHLTIVRQDRKTDNRQVFWNTERPGKAITQKRKVSFTYLEYGFDKKLQPRRKKPYVVNPYGMVYMNEHYYLICNLDGYPNTSLYRIDRIKDIKISEDSADASRNFEYETKNATYAFAGKPEQITMYCDKIILNDVLDKFGTDIHIQEQEGKTFSVSFIASPHGIEFWALQYLPYVEVIEPKWLRDKIIESVKKNQYVSLNSVKN